MGKPKISLSEVSQSFQLTELLSEKQIKQIKKQRKLGEFRKEFSDDAIQTVIERTQSGEDIRGNAFKPYSPAYAERKGVSRFDVDLTLTENMLNSVTPTKDEIKIKVGRGINTKKAYNHCVGSTLPKRNFFGLLQKDAKAIAQSVYDDLISGEETTTTPREQRASEQSEIESVNRLADFLDVEFEL